MRRFVLIDDQGCVFGQGTVPDSSPVPEGAVEVPNEGDLSDWANRLYDPDNPDPEGAVPRTPLPEPVIEEDLPTLTWQDLPEGTVLTVEDAELAEVLGSLSEEDGEIVLQLEDAGSYHLTLTPPVQFLPWKSTVTLP